MNPLPDGLNTGTLGELLVQIRLLQFGVQAAPPVKDSGNDLIAVRGEVFRAIQVKTTTGDTYQVNKLPERYHILAIVQLNAANGDVHLDKSPVFLIPKDRVSGAPRSCGALEEYKLAAPCVDRLFPA